MPVYQINSHTCKLGLPVRLLYCSVQPGTLDLAARGGVKLESIQSGRWRLLAFDMS